MKTTIESTNSATDQTTTTPENSGEDVRVFGKPLPVDEDQVFTRVERMLAVNLIPPQVYVQRPRLLPRARDGELFSRQLQLLGIEYSPTNRSLAQTAFARTDGKFTITIFAGTNVSREELVKVLVHEYVNIAQRQNVRVLNQHFNPVTQDGLTAYFGVKEGAADYVLDEYEDRYLTADESVSRFSGQWADFEPWQRYRLAAYHFGAKYVAARVDSPANLSTVYTNPARTTEQLLHPSTIEMPAPLNVSVNASGWHSTTRTRRGELFVRVLLGSQIPLEHAAEAATGWENDELVTFERDGANASYAWVLRWESQNDAAELRLALTNYLDAMANETGAARWQTSRAYYRVEQINASTYVLYFGERGFVGNATTTFTRE